MKKGARVIMIPVAVGISMLPLPSDGEFYQYQDEQGTVHFTDDPGKIPKRYRGRQKVREDTLSDPDGSLMRVTISGNHVLVPVVLGYRGREVRTTFILDTGAATCTISPGLARKLKIDPRDADAVLAQGVGGGAFLVGHTKLDFVSVGPNRKYNLDVSIVTSGVYDGLLGMNFLKGLRYHVDFDTSTIRWGD